MFVFEHSLKFSCMGSNHDPQSQNLMCYHYTTGKFCQPLRVLRPHIAIGLQI